MKSVRITSSLIQGRTMKPSRMETLGKQKCKFIIFKLILWKTLFHKFTDSCIYGTFASITFCELTFLMIKSKVLRYIIPNGAVSLFCPELYWKLVFLAGKNRLYYNTIKSTVKKRKRLSERVVEQGSLRTEKMTTSKFYFVYLYL